MVKVHAIVPFFGGTSTATHSLEDTRVDYLHRTLESLEENGITYTVFQSRKDKVDIRGAFGGGSTLLDIEPIWLPWAACTAVQRGYAGLAADVYYVTEADQVLHVHDEDVYKIPDATHYLAPWRLDMVGPNGECEVQTAARYEIGDVEYSIANGAHHLMQAAGWGVLPIHANQQAFSGAFFATREYFKKIKFRKMRLLPVEHATGFDANAVGTCVKTEWLERCWVDHLSPRDRWQQPE
jgi:hypothetical protein